MTIEEKYEELRERAAAMREAIDMLGTEHAARPDRSLPYGRAVLALVAQHATHIAAEAWPELRAGLAQQGAKMPQRPVTFGFGGGFAWRRYAGELYSIYVSGAAREVSPWEQYLDQAELLAVAEYTPLVNAAEAAFERYRLAVAQGVAVAPEDSEVKQ